MVKEVADQKNRLKGWLRVVKGALGWSRVLKGTKPINTYYNNNIINIIVCMPRF